MQAVDGISPRSHRWDTWHAQSRTGYLPPGSSGYPGCERPGFQWSSPSFGTVPPTARLYRTSAGADPGGTPGKVRALGCAGLPTTPRLWRYSPVPIRSTPLWSRCGRGSDPPLHRDQAAWFRQSDRDPRSLPVSGRAPAEPGFRIASDFQSVRGLLESRCAARVRTRRSVSAVGAAWSSRCIECAVRFISSHARARAWASMTAPSSARGTMAYTRSQSSAAAARESASSVTAPSRSLLSKSAIAWRLMPSRWASWGALIPSPWRMVRSHPYTGGFRGTDRQGANRCSICWISRSRAGLKYWGIIVYAFPATDEWRPWSDSQVIYCHYYVKCQSLTCSILHYSQATACCKRPGYPKARVRAGSLRNRRPSPRDCFVGPSQGLLAMTEGGCAARHRPEKRRPPCGGLAPFAEARGGIDLPQYRRSTAACQEMARG